MSKPTHIVHRILGEYRPGQLVNALGWRWRRQLEDQRWIDPYDGVVHEAADGTMWATPEKAAARGGAPPAQGEYEFTTAAEAVIEGAGYELADYDGVASGAAGDVLKRDAEEWVDRQ